MDQSDSKTTRITKDGYKRPKRTQQDKMSPDDIKKALENYIQVDEISQVPLKSHLRYFTVNLKTGKKLFRLGGFLSNKDNSDKYVVLSNGKITWSVDTTKSVFFKKMSLDEVREEYEDEIKKLRKDNKALKKALKQIKEQIKSKKR